MNLLLLDLDGVLITTPSWKSDEMDVDNYSKFDKKCVANLNELLRLKPFTIWLSSSRRKSMPLDEFNRIFRRRLIDQPITGYLDVDGAWISRKDEIENFLRVTDFKNFIALDDDTSLRGLSDAYRANWVETSLYKGFDNESLQKAKRICSQWK